MELPYIIDFEHIYHNEGNITIAENTNKLPFIVNRVYWLTGISKGQTRGNNATIKGKRILAVLQGSVEISLESLTGRSYNYILKSPQQGLYIPNGYWSKISFPDTAILVCLVSNLFDETDYIRDYQKFLTLDKLP